MNIKGIAFDLGGVLFLEGKTIALKKLSEEMHYNPDIVLKALTTPESFLLRAGLIEDQEFWNFTQRHLPEGYDANLIKKYWYDGYVIDSDIFDLIKNLHGKYKIIAFSGNIKSRIDYLDKKYDFRKYFDLEIYSFDYHLNKPDEKFIQALIEKSELNPQELIYIDDAPELLFPAEKMGINTIVYATGDIKDLKRTLCSFDINI